MQCFINGAAAPGSAETLSIRCPACKQIGTFQGVGNDLFFPDEKSGQLRVDNRMCPNPSCQAHLFVVFENGTLCVSFPSERIGFDSTDIPRPIIESFEEAITCHANQCFVAADIIARKTLELLCSSQSATGGNLKERIKALGSKVVLPTDLLGGLDELRLLGNHAGPHRIPDVCTSKPKRT